MVEELLNAIVLKYLCFAIIYLEYLEPQKIDNFLPESEEEYKIESYGAFLWPSYRA